MQLIIIFMVVWTVMLFLVSAGYLPDYFIVAGPFIMLVGVVLGELLITYKLYAGKTFASIAIRVGEEDSEWCFAPIKAVKTLNTKNSSAIFLELDKAPLIESYLPFRGCILIFPNKYELSQLVDRDYVVPQHVSFKIPIWCTYLSGIKVGDYVTQRIKEPNKIAKLFGAKQKFERETYPMVLITRAKPFDLEIMKIAKDQVLTTSKLPPKILAEELKLRSWIDEMGNIVVIDTEKEYLLASLQETERENKELKAALADQGTVFMVQERFVPPEKVESVITGKKWSRVALYAALGIALLILILLLGGVL